MSFVEIFEFNVKPGNRESLKQAAVAFVAAAAKCSDGLEKMEFQMVAGSETLLWQSMYWRSKADVAPAQKKLFMLPEMGLFSYFLASPPRRVQDLETL